ncbi:DUF523 and DUF1722 domain-containing protein [Chitinispirillales bacterium ANBcel5]|uniref:YbgA family protein n=1 Tax=Cellulosispirillum alkaliphilum TaxID=3039283 RepID=UPI002A4F95F9|nr:DUF523 and DUF1722 domain-containing protein [Chitinispirillales bacterium ANBcel5]
MEEKRLPLIRLGISACLLGQKVRYDGNHKLDRYLRDTLGRFVQWIPVCPEVECGLGVPRERMFLLETKSGSRVRRKDGEDLTEQIAKWSNQKKEWLATQDLCGFIFKCKSPSCGLRDTKIYCKGAVVRRKSAGVFASSFSSSFPILPKEDEGRLHNSQIRESFVERVFIYARWLELTAKPLTMHAITEWHADHKLIFMAHSPVKARELGSLVANGGNRDITLLSKEYIGKVMDILDTQASVNKHVNVLYHIAGYFKKELSGEEKRELNELIVLYHRTLVPLIVPLTLLNHYIEKYNKSYLERQYYFNPYPAELKLRSCA